MGRLWQGGEAAESDTAHPSGLEYQGVGDKLSMKPSALHLQALRNMERIVN